MWSLVATVIYLIRHGQSTSNAAGLLVGRSDPALTERGEAQATALRPLLTGVREVWSSPLQRAHHTAKLCFPDLPIHLEPNLIEVDYGHLDGTALDDLTASQWTAMEAAHDHKLGAGESLADVDARVHPLLESLYAQPDSLLHDPDQHLAMVSHVSPIKSALLWAMGAPGGVAWRMRIENASLSVVGARRTSPTVVRVNLLP